MCYRLRAAKVSELTTLTHDIESMVTRLGAPATETPLPVQRQIQRAVAAVF